MYISIVRTRRHLTFLRDGELEMKTGKRTIVYSFHAAASVFPHTFGRLNSTLSGHASANLARACKCYSKHL